MLQENEITHAHRLREVIMPDTIRLDNIPKPWYKVVLGWNSQKLKDIEVYLSKKTGLFHTVFSESQFLDILHASTSKGGALKRLMEIFEIDNSDVIAVGDNLNDLEMLNVAGIGVAVENAHEELKKCARFCSSHHDNHAVANVIRWVEENI